MHNSRNFALVAAISLLSMGLLASGCSHPNMPAGGVAPETLGQQNVSGQAGAYQERLNHDPMMKRGEATGSGMAQGQAAAMAARARAQGQHP